MPKAILNSDSSVLAIVQDDIPIESIQYAVGLEIIELQEETDVTTGYRYVDGVWLPPPTPAYPDLLSIALKTIQGHLDSVAKAWGYDDIKSAVSYIGDPNPKYNAEGIILRNFRSATWTKAEELHILPEPPVSQEELLSHLPAVPTRPQPPY
jgi:hypothetical protein